MILLDTHVLYWVGNDPKRLSKAAYDAIRKARSDDGIAIATVSLFELAWMAENGRIEVLGSVESFVRDSVARFILKPMTPEIAAQAVRFGANYPKDPADRVIGSTAILEGMPLVTADVRIRASQLVRTIW